MQAAIDSMNDSELIARIQSRDGNAMAALYDRYKRLVFTVANRVLHDTGSAEDLSHEVFLAVWRKPPTESASASIGPWLAVVARNRAIDLIRRKKFVADVPADSSLPEPSETPRLDREFLGNRAREAVLQLGAEQRQALEMAYFDGMSHSEIAEKTGIPLGTIKTRIRTGLQALRREFHC